jgi:hypothetical protein
MTSRLIRRPQVIVALLALTALASVGYTQELVLRYYSGQSVQPGFEGWMRKPDGTFDLWFGYMNRNYKETPDIPVGPNNGFGAGGDDLGQPTHFLTGRQEFAFKVTVPADMPKDRDVIWTVNVNGQNLKAYGSLRPALELDERYLPIQTEARLVTGRSNLGPRLAASPPTDQIATVGVPLSLTLSVSDDGIPQLMARRAGAPEPPAPDPNTDAPPRTLRVRWIQYRGAGRALFTPTFSHVIGADGKPAAYSRQGTPVSAIDGTATTRVTFDRRGTFTVRAYAMDPDMLFDIRDVTVTVK